MSARIRQVLLRVSIKSRLLELADNNRVITKDCITSFFFFFRWLLLCQIDLCFWYYQASKLLEFRKNRNHQFQSHGGFDKEYQAGSHIYGWTERDARMPGMLYYDQWISVITNYSLCNTCVKIDLFFVYVRCVSECQEILRFINVIEVICYVMSAMEN